MPQLRLALAQVNPTVGDLAGNAEQIARWCREAAEVGAHLVAFPEMALSGYPIEDLALRSSFVEAARGELTELARRLDVDGLGDLPVVVGCLDRVEGASGGVGVPKGSPQDSAAVLHRGAVVLRQAKHHLWNYGVGDEIRYFVPGDAVNIVRVRGVDVALAVCEDIWRDGPSEAATAAGAGLLLVVNGSPYERDKDDTRHELCARRAREAGCALAWVNLVGGQDELVFDGDSLVVGADGALIARGEQFVEQLLVVDLDLPAGSDAAVPEMVGKLRLQRHVLSSDPVAAYPPVATDVASPAANQADDGVGVVWRAIVLGLRDYVRKNGFGSVLLGMSGGIDSTVVAQLACDAVGPDNVHGVSNPSAWSTEHSRSDAAEHAHRTGLHLRTVPIAELVDGYERQLPGLGEIAGENLQARLRAVTWMALSNDEGHLVLACGNKSELATGYSTIYGDAVGGFAPIKDVPKTTVWELARWRNAQADAAGDAPPIPENIIAKPPSAELRPGQLDTDSLPPYELLDDILDDYVERDASSTDLVELGFDRELVEHVIRLVDQAEWKRRQYPPGPKISIRNFGRDRRVPITNAWREHLP
ncbi:MAG: NAD+ synthase [Nocardioidaceae bacterium]|nr:NAD+ synthase [Nocardioidaceae bacterium]